MPFFDNYPYTNLHNVNLDWVLQKVKAWGEMVEQNNQNFIDLQAANESFKEYVTGYLTNLDVQDEINNKLDDMLASGALTQYFSPYIKTDVEDWLEENITPTTPPVDASLTIAGAAADAKATGDAIRNITTQLDGYLWTFPIKEALRDTLKNLVAFDGNKYLVPGITITENTRIEVRAAFNSNINGQYMGTILKDGNNYKRAHFGVVVTSGVARITVNATLNYTDFNVIPYDNAPHTYTFYAGHCGIDNNVQAELPSMNDGFPIGTDFYLFYRNNNGGTYSQTPCRASVYFMKVYESGVLVHDFEPVSVDGSMKLYDEIGHTYCTEVSV